MLEPGSTEFSPNQYIILSYGIQPNCALKARTYGKCLHIVQGDQEPRVLKCTLVLQSPGVLNPVSTMDAALIYF